MQKAQGTSVGGVSVFTDLSRSQKEHLIDEWICNERDRYVLKRRLLDGVTFERLADELEQDQRFIGISSRQIQTIARKGINIILKHIS